MQDLRWPTYPPRKVVLTDAVDPGRHGALRLRAADGKVYLDAIAGIGCAPLGHAHPRWVEAVSAQMERVVASANTFWTEPQQALAAALIERFPVDNARVFFANTGAEATEAAIKLALRSTGRDVIVAFDGAFHGRTLGAISLTANPAYRDPYVTCLGEEHEGRFASVNVVRVPFGDLDALGRVFEKMGSRVAGVFLEPIQGEAGVYPATREFLAGARRLCDEHGALLGADEIQSGCGRTGDWAAWTTLTDGDPAVRPDILWLAKALGGGYPIGACLARTELSETMTPGTHGTTFGGNPAACAAALATLKVIEEEQLMGSAHAQIELIRELAVARPIARVTEIRGRGAMIGIELAGDAGSVGAALMARGVLVTVCRGKTVRLLLPYRAGAPELGEIWDALAAVAS